jgi:hypothetical protein
MPSYGSRKIRPALAVSAAVLAMAFLGACGLSPTTVQTAPIGSAASSGATASSQPAPSTVGSTLRLSDIKGGQLDITVNAVINPVTSGNEFEKPDAGQQFVAVSLTAFNSGKAPFSGLLAFGVSLYDSNGQEARPRILSEVRDSNGKSPGADLPNSPTIAPGDKVSGIVTFQVATGAKLDRVQMSLDAGMSNDVGKWAISK